MKFAFKILVGLSLIQGTAFAFQGPEIQVMDGKITMTAQAVPLGQVLTMLDRATGLSSKVLKPELARRNISVRFKELDLRDAVQKIFEGQPLNYVLIAGKGIQVTDAAQGGPATGTSTAPSVSSSFPNSQPVISNQPLQPGVPTIQPVNAVQPANAASQPANANNPFGATPPPAATPPSGPGQATITPGQLPPPIGASNITPAGAAQPAPAGVIFPGGQTTPTGGIPFPGAQTAPASQPTGPGAAGATPGTVR